MKLNSPIPQPLTKECTKAARIFKSFVDGSNNGLDGVIPRSVLENARGFAIFTIFKAGFLFSARAGSGIVIARLDDGTWSSPSAIGTAGLGVGGQVGAEMTDFLIVLNTRSAIQTFMAAGSLTLGGNLSLALGPLGRNGEALGSLNTSGKVAAMYSYSKTRGLFGGISVEGSVIVERQDANAIAYRSPVTARMLLGGAVPPPEWSSFLIQTLESCTGLPGGRKWVQEGSADGPYAFGGMASPGTEPNPTYLRKKRKDNRPSFPPNSWGNSKETGSYFSSTESVPQTSGRGRVAAWDQDDPAFPFEARFESDFVSAPQPTRHSRLTQSVSNSSLPTPLDMSYDNPSPSSRMHSRSYSMASPRHRNSSHVNDFAASAGSDSRSRFSAYNDDLPLPYIVPKPELTKPLQPHEGIARAIALYNFQAVESGDLSFSKGDVIVIVQKSNSNDDWWTGKIGSRQGIFPANFVEVV
ncbi:hypothetical protein D9615_006335 [Tricholomella constricta]|uniref:SH3 domain-containing protein n=1 Tax=Tricholomella constricta TaxID=117010 RepID=A0A8H5M1G7_9AGAR|nr:hypothetical protein D9615_006335 [Tricholomella constricta]